MDKILFLGKGSEKDPGFGDVSIAGVGYKEYMEKRGITVIDPPVIESCHGCEDLMNRYGGEMQYLVEKGDRVVAVLQGGLSFGLPGMQAKNVTYPIIACPMDFVAYQSSFILPKGHAVVSAVGVERKVETEKDKNETEKDKKPRYETEQRAKALVLAANMLDLENDKVAVFQDNESGTLTEKVAGFGIEVTSDDNHDGLTLINSLYRYDRAKTASVVLRQDPGENANDEGYLVRAEIRHHRESFNHAPTCQVWGEKNLAIYAAKILSLQRPELRREITKIRAEKRNDYESRNLLEELGKVEEV